MRESDIETYLVKQAIAFGGEIRKVKWIGRRGAPDRLLMFPHVLVWVEVKAPGKGLEPHQEREFHRLYRVGQVARMVNSMEDVDELVRTASSASQRLRLRMDEPEGNA